MGTVSALREISGLFTGKKLTVRRVFSCLLITWGEALGGMADGMKYMTSTGGG